MGIEIWPIIKLALRKTVGEAAFINWINPLELRSLDKSKASFVAPTKFIGDWVDRNYGDSIKFEFAKQGLDVDRLSFTVDIHSKRVQSEKPAINSNKDNMKTGSVDLPGASLDPRYTFDNFVVGKPNELAHAAARRVAEGGDVSFNPLFLHGGVGLGKTHLMHAIAWEIKKRDPNAKVLYLSAEQFMYRFVQALRFKDTISFKEMFRSVDVLMVDDVQFIAGKSSTQEEFFHTFNALIDQNKQVIISGDRAPVDMEQLEDRIKSRLQWGLVVDVHPTDYELRLGILQSKQETQSRYNSTVEVSPGVLEFMAQRISSNVRVLEGALTRLYAFGSLVGRPVTLEMAQESLSDILRASDRKVTIDEIIRKVTDHYGVNLTDMLSARRTRSIARPRQVAMYLSKKLTSKSLPEIGRRFGKRDHTTVIHAVKKIEELQSVDNQIAKDIEVLRRVLEG
ncbi:chromosomal replication initiator protein DnaA [Amylibacter sp.]|nr:chromosomal replication initiator protein DnaA [Amylibacter sp.]MDB4095684.1 chromosomal replication initiator protein DnaA [Amylibacter sp.]MDB4191081.1 chromosomal replication initiator protein DnaA [Amylibacter sp.]MDB9740071.1 chromosomal replication initiator protein DnaA [Amylibacter sp.]MDC0565156.1 chromosomal replication initiator protein DnaA [Amylibacter sp.]